MIYLTVYLAVAAVVAVACAWDLAEDKDCSGSALSLTLVALCWPMLMAVALLMAPGWLLVRAMRWVRQVGGRA